jgi:hypothetical protein
MTFFRFKKLAERLANQRIVIRDQNRPNHAAPFSAKPHGFTEVPLQEYCSMLTTFQI